MDVRHENLEMKCDKFSGQLIRRTRLRVLLIRICICISIWTLLVELVTVGGLWHPHLLTRMSNHRNKANMLLIEEKVVRSSPPFLPESEFS